MRPPNKPEFLWRKVTAGTPNECWPWTGILDRHGYGYMKVANAVVKCHRLAWSLSNGVPLSSDFLILHHCDNRKCCNPAHLYRGTNADNSRDMSVRGRVRPGSALYPERMPRGEAHMRATLTNELIGRIFKMMADGMTQIAIGAEVGCSQAHVSRVLRHHCWVHVSTEAA